MLLRTLTRRAAIPNGRNSSLVRQGASPSIIFARHVRTARRRSLPRIRTSSTPDGYRISREEVLEHAKDLTSRTEDGTATVPELIKILTNVQAHVENLPQRDAKIALCRELNLGSRTLMWLWTHMRSADKYDQLTLDFLGPLCWLLVGEGREDYLRKWVYIVCSESVEMREQGQQERSELAYELGGRLSGKWLEAFSHWSCDNPNDVVNACVELCESLESAGKYHRGLSDLHFLVACERFLLNIDNPPCDASLFECFTPFRTRAGGHPEVTRARLKLFHPSEPSATEYLALVESEHPYASEALLARIRPHAKLRLAYGFLRAAHILRIQGLEEGAAKLEAIVARHVTLSTHKRQTCLAQLENDPRLENLRARHRQQTTSQPPSD